MSYALFIIILLLIIAIGWCGFIDQAFLFKKDTIISTGNNKNVALTFDDGPHPNWTPEILDILDRHKVRATFFLVGSQAEIYPDLVKQIFDRGHQIGNHSYSHKPLWLLTSKGLAEEINRTQEVIKSITGKYPAIVRPPKGMLRPNQKREIRRFKLKIILWSINSKDWFYRSSKKIVNKVLNDIRGGDIILLHDGGGVFFPIKGDRSATIEALSSLIMKIKSDGYEITSLNTI